MRKKTSLFTTLFIAAPLLFLLNCSKYESVKEIEENTFNSPQIIEADNVIHGKIDITKERDKDVYKFHIEEDEREINILLKHSKGVDLRLFLYNENLNAIDASDNFNYYSETINEGHFEELPSLKIRKGAYYILVEEAKSKKYKQSEKAIKYRLYFSETNISYNKEYEVNNDFSNAIELNPNTTFKGYFSPANDLSRKKSIYGKHYEEDVYFIKNPLNETLMFSVLLTGVKNVDSLIMLFDEEENLLAKINRNSKGEGEEIKDHLFLRESKYYIVLVNLNKTLNSKIPYEITVKTKGYEDGNENEPNNDKSQAKNIEYGLKYRGKHNYINDKDIFRFFVPESDGANIHFEITGVHRADAKVLIQNDDDSVKILVDKYAMGEGEAIANKYLPKGFYTLCISLKNEYYSDDEYEFILESLARANSWEWEVNDNFSNANEIYHSTENVFAYLGEEEDEDFFKIKLHLKKEILFEALPPLNVDIKISLFDGYGNLIVDANKNPKEGRSEAIEKVLESGVYYVKIESEKGFNATSRYSLNIKRNTPPHEDDYGNE